MPDETADVGKTPRGRYKRLIEQRMMPILKETVANSR